MRNVIIIGWKEQNITKKIDGLKKEKLNTMIVSYFKTEIRINNNKEVKQIMDNKQLINNIIYKLKKYDLCKIYALNYLRY